MNTSLIKQLNNLQQTITELKNKLENINTNMVISNDDIKCENTLTTNNLTVNNLTQILGNVNLYGDLYLDSSKIHFNDSCYLFVKDNILCFNNGNKDMLVNLTEIN
jgi:hypothetical protein